jgi:hypothetical protein
VFACHAHLRHLPRRREAREQAQQCRRLIRRLERGQQRALDELVVVMRRVQLAQARARLGRIARRQELAQQRLIRQHGHDDIFLRA